MKFIWIIAGTVLVGLVLGFWVSRVIYDDAVPQVPVVKESSTPAPTPVSPATPLVTDNKASRPNPRWRRLRQPAPPPGNLLTNWEERIQEILTSDDDEDEQAKEMLELFPRLPMDGQVEVAEQVGGLLPDRDYGLLAEYTTNTSLAEPVLEALLSGLMNRPDAIRLPLLLGIAENEEHPKSDEARDILETLLGQAYGTNWEQWNSMVDQRLNAQSQDQSSEMMESGPPEE